MRISVIPAIVACIVLIPSARAADPPATQPAATQGSNADISVAILDFDATTGSPDLGKQITDILGICLSGQPGFHLVDRAGMVNLLREHEVNLSGLVDPSQTIKIGKLAGADHHHGQGVHVGQAGLHYRQAHWHRNQRGERGHRHRP